MEKEIKEKLPFILGICFAIFLNPFMVSAVGISLPQIAAEFGLNPAQLGLIETIYLVASVTLLLPVGKLADQIGLSKFFFLGICIFCLTTFLMAIAPSYVFLVSFRFLQGAAIACISATGVALLTKEFSPHLRGRVIGIAVASVYTGLSLGPSIGGYLTEHFGWRMIFIVGAVGGLLALVAVFKYINFAREHQGIHFNFKAALAYFVLILAMWAFLGHLKENPLLYTPLGILSLIGFGLFLRSQYHHPHPIVEVRIFAENKEFLLGNMICYINYTASAAMVFSLSLYLQYIQKLGPHEAGLVLLVQPVIMALFAPLSGRLSDKIEPTILTTWGMLCATLGLAVVTLLDESSPLYLIIGLLVFIGLGFALFSSANINQIMSSVGPKYFGVASSTSGTMRTFGMLSSITIVSSSFAYFIGDEQMRAGLEGPFLKAIHLSFGLFVVLSIVGTFISYRLYKLRQRAR